MNMFDLTGKIALVTGGAHSIGFAIGRGLAKAGAKVIFNCTSEGSRQRGIANYARIMLARPLRPASLAIWVAGT